MATDIGGGGRSAAIAPMAHGRTLTSGRGVYSPAEAQALAFADWLGARMPVTWRLRRVRLNQTPAAGPGKDRRDADCPSTPDDWLRVSLPPWGLGEASPPAAITNATFLSCPIAFGADEAVEGLRPSVLLSPVKWTTPVVL